MSPIVTILAGLALGGAGLALYDYSTGIWSVTDQISTGVATTDTDTDTDDQAELDEEEAGSSDEDEPTTGQKIVNTVEDVGHVVEIAIAIGMAVAAAA